MCSEGTCLVRHHPSYFVWLANRAGNRTNMNQPLRAKFQQPSRQARHRLDSRPRKREEVAWQ